MKISKKIVKGNEIQKSKGKLLTILKVILLICFLLIFPSASAQQTPIPKNPFAVNSILKMKEEMEEGSISERK